ncbi:MAG: hypothetical protein ABR946_09145 [Solirubrobacteraceae bacterium]|jgi:hypothetical protein
MERVLTRPRFLGAVGLVALATGLFAAWIGLRVGGGRVTLWVDDLVTPLAALIACVLCMRARARHSGRMRLFWTLFGCAMASWTLAEIIWGYYALILSTALPVVSWADVGYLSAIPIAVAALVVHPATHGSSTRRTRWVFDALVVASALLFLSWTLVLGPLWRSSDPGTWSGIVALAYPFGDVVIVFFIVLAIRGMTSGDRLSLWCLLAALLVMALADSAYTYLTASSSYTSPGLIDTGWVAAYLGIALAAFSSQPRSEVVLKADRERPSLVSLVAPLVPVLIALTVTAVEIRLGHHLDHAAWLMAFALVAVVLVRQALILFELLGPGHGPYAGPRERLVQAALRGAPDERPALQARDYDPA